MLQISLGIFFLYKRSCSSAILLWQAKSGFIPKSTHLDSLTIRSFLRKKNLAVFTAAAIASCASYGQTLCFCSWQPQYDWSCSL